MRRHGGRRAPAQKRDKSNEPSARKPVCPGVGGEGPPYPRFQQGVPRRRSWQVCQRLQAPQPKWRPRTGSLG